MYNLSRCLKIATSIHPSPAESSSQCRAATPPESERADEKTPPRITENQLKNTSPQVHAKYPNDPTANVAHSAAFAINSTPFSEQLGFIEDSRMDITRLAELAGKQRDCLHKSDFTNGMTLTERDDGFNGPRFVCPGMFLLIGEFSWSAGKLRRKVKRRLSRRLRYCLRTVGTVGAFLKRYNASKNAYSFVRTCLRTSRMVLELFLFIWTQLECFQGMPVSSWCFFCGFWKFSEQPRKFRKHESKAWEIPEVFDFQVLQNSFRELSELFQIFRSFFNGFSAH